MEKKFMSLVNIISAVGNNSSIYPLIVRDCGVEVPVKIGMTYSQNLKDSKEMANHAFRERTLDEYGTSIVWLGGIPLINKICNWGIKKLGLNPDINPSLFKESKTQGAKFNIEKFKNLAPKEVEELEKVLKNKKKYESLQIGKFALSTLIPIIIMGVIIPKLNFALTANIKNKKEKQKQSLSQQKPINENISFKGFGASLINMKNVNKMAITDGGLTIGRVGTARNKYEKMEMGFKMSAMMFLNYLAPIWIAKFFDKTSNKILNTNVDLDPKILNDKDFIKSIVENKFSAPTENLIDFLDKNPDSKFAQFAEKYCGVKYLKNRIRDPRIYINEKKLMDFANELNNFKSAAQKSKNPVKFAKKALRVKSANILANIALSSFLLAFGLPKLTFVLRKLVTGSEAEPGLLE